MSLSNSAKYDFVSIEIRSYGHYNIDIKRTGNLKEGEDMFFKKNKNEKKQQKQLEMLKLENIKLDCKRADKEMVIRQVGQMLCDSGYVDQEYVDAMVKREETFATNIGNGIALPHGVEEAKKNVKSSGIAVMVFPEGTDWGGEDVKLVIGIAGVGDEHLNILANIAEKMSTPEAVGHLVTCSQEKIHQILNGEG